MDAWIQGDSREALTDEQVGLLARFRAAGSGWWKAGTSLCAVSSHYLFLSPPLPARLSLPYGKAVAWFGCCAEVAMALAKEDLVGGFGQRLGSALYGAIPPPVFLVDFGFGFGVGRGGARFGVYGTGLEEALLRPHPHARPAVTLFCPVPSRE